MKRFSLWPIIVLLNLSCAEKESKTIWVYPYRLNGILSPYAEQGKYLLYQELGKLDYSSWNIIPTENYEIRGLNFEEGFFYQLLVELEENAPSQRWKLKSIIENRLDFVSRIEGNWKNVPIPNQPYSPIFIRVKKLTRTLETYGGCAKGITGIGEVGERKIQLADTYYRLELDKICLAQNPGIGGDFSFVGSTTEYQLTKEGFLEFFDESGNLLIRFQPSE